jgi:hypothetical protein
VRFDVFKIWKRVREMPGLTHQDEGQWWFEVLSKMRKTKTIPLPMVLLVHNRDCVHLSIQRANISRDVALNKADILDSFLTVNNRWILKPGPGVRARGSSRPTTGEPAAKSPAS